MKLYQGFFHGTKIQPGNLTPTPLQRRGNRKLNATGIEIKYIDCIFDENKKNASVEELMFEYV